MFIDAILFYFLVLKRFCYFFDIFVLLLTNFNMPNLHNRNKSVEGKISQKNPEFMLKMSSNVTAATWQGAV
jgi:hypothetical protein